MKKTFLEWSVADKKEQREKFIKQMLSTPTRWGFDYRMFHEPLMKLKYVKNFQGSESFRMFAL